MIAVSLLRTARQKANWLGRIRRSRIGGWLASLLLFALALLIIALARPQQGKTISHVEASGIDIMLALDVSRSMLAEDIVIGRFHCVRENLTQVLAGVKADAES